MTLPRGATIWYDAYVVVAAENRVDECDLMEARGDTGSFDGTHEAFYFVEWASLLEYEMEGGALFAKRRDEC